MAKKKKPVGQVKILFRGDAEFLSQINAAAEAAKLSRSAWIRQACLQKLQKKGRREEE